MREAKNRFQFQVGDTGREVNNAGRPIGLGCSCRLKPPLGATSKANVKGQRLILERRHILPTLGGDHSLELFPSSPEAQR